MDYQAWRQALNAGIPVEDYEYYSNGLMRVANGQSSPGSPLGVVSKVGYGFGLETSQPSAFESFVLPQPLPLETPPQPPVAGFGGVQDRLRPRLTAASNQKALWNKVPLVLGYVKKVYPLISANAYQLFRGRKNTLHVGMDFCYGDVKIVDPMIGDKTMTKLKLVSGTDYVVQEGVAGDPEIGELYSNDAEVLDVQVPALRNQDIIRTCLQEADEIIVAFSFDSGLYSYTTTTLEDGSVSQDRTSYTVQFKIEYREAGSTGAWTTAAATYSVTDSTENPFMVAYSFKPATRKTYEVKVRRLTNTGAGSDAALFYSLTAVLYVDPYNDAVAADGSVVRFARIVCAIDADKNIQGVLGQVSATEIRSRFPIYSGGSWSAPQETNNPAWLAIGVMRGHNGCNPRPIPDALIDIQSFVDFANYCAEKGYTYNRVIDAPIKLRLLVDEICRLGRARVVKKNGLYTCVIDKSRSNIEQHFTIWNTIKGSFKFRSRQSLKTHAVRVNWLDPNDNNTQAQRTAYNDGFTSLNARRFEVVDLPGCTDAVNAYKEGRRKMAEQELRSKMIEFTTGWDSLTCSIGGLIAVNHDAALLGIASGKIKSMTTDGSGNVTSITLNQGCSMDPTGNYELRIRKSDYSSLVAGVFNPGGGEFTTLTMMPPIPSASAPAVGDLCQFGPEGGSARIFIVVAIERLSQHAARIVAEEYHDGVYTAETGEIPDYESNTTPLPPVQETVPPPVIVSVRSDESVLKKLGNDIYISQIVMTMAPVPEKVAFFEYRYKKSTSPDNWSASQFVGAQSGAITISGVSDGETYDIEIRSVTAYGIKSPVVSEQVTVIGKTTKPPDIVYLNMREGRLLHIGLTADLGFNRPLDFVGVQVRMAWGIGDVQDVWDNAVVMAPLFTGDLYPVENFGAGDKTWLVKAVDSSGNMSENAAILRQEHGALDFANITESYDFADDDFAGVTITGGSVVSGVIKADQLTNAAASHYKDGQGAPYFKGEGDESLYGDYYSAMVLEFNAVPDGITPGAIFTLDLEGVDATNYRVFYLPPVDDLFWAGDSGGLHYGASGDDYYSEPSASPPMVPFPTEGIAAKRQAYAFRIEFDASFRQSQVPHIKIITDAPDVTDYVDDLVVTPSGTVATPTKSFYKIKSVSVTLQSHPDYPSAVRAVADKTVLPPIIKVFDANGDPTSGLVDVILKGV